MKAVRNTVWRICATALLGAAASASAQTIYRQVDDAGRSTFTDRPPSGSAIVAYAISLPDARLGSASRPLVGIGARPDVARALRSHSAMTSMYAATVDLNEATRRLRQARQSLQEEMEPRPGEWADSAYQLNARYQRRQQKLKREVVAAERRSHETSLVQSTLLRIALSRSDARIEPLDLAPP